MHSAEWTKEGRAIDHSDKRPRVVIVGGGFAGLSAARKLRNEPLDVTLVDRNNFHLFQPLLYQVATGGLSPADIASPLRSIVGKARNTRVLLGNVTGVDPQRQEVLVQDVRLPFDFLLIATGSQHHYFGHDEWSAVAPGLKRLEDALEMRQRIFTAFERAERETDPERRQALLTFVVVGGGPTGVELAGALGELAHHTLRHDFRAITTSDATILLVEGLDRLLTAYPPQQSRRAAQDLEKLGVTVRTSTLVESVEPGGVVISSPEGTERIAAETVLWGAGVKASPLGKMLADAAGARLDRQGRVHVEPDLSLAGHANIFVLGDLARFDQDGEPLPGIAPVAIQQGSYVARLLRRRARGRETPAFRYKDRGQMAVIGRSAAVAQLGRLRLQGFVAWLMWLLVHLVNLVEYENRVLVFIQWGWNYVTRNRSARLITRQATVKPADSTSAVADQKSP